MEFHLLPILALISLVVAAGHAALPTEVYWNSVLPNTAMPKAIRDILRPDLMEEKGTSVSVGKGGVNVHAGKGKSGGGTTVGVGKGTGVNVHAGKGKPGGGTTVGVGKGGVSVNAGHKGKHVYVGDQLHDDPNVALFFFEKNMQPGTKMELHFIRDANLATFLPRQVANSIPFSSKKFPEILNEFSIKPESEEAETIKNTIRECEEPGIKGEEKYCATSLESMVDFSTSKLGKEGNPEQQYTITTGVKKLAGDKAVVCHKQSYPYAVFYCHKTQTTRAYMVPLVGADGSKVKAVAVCHTDTSAWNPKHLAFQVLKVKPGTVPICHFLPEDHVVWVPK
ncbi:hypothetical protein AAG906_002390 [Vitis piasezkii]